MSDDNKLHNEHARELLKKVAFAYTDSFDKLKADASKYNAAKQEFDGCIASSRALIKLLVEDWV